MEPLIKLFLEDQGNYVFGPGRAALLQAVETLGSLNKAAQKQGMSYRWAWGRIKEAEEALGVPLLEASDAPGSGNTKKLTPEAYALLDWFYSLENEIMNLSEKAKTQMPEWLKR